MHKQKQKTIHCQKTKAQSNYFEIIGMLDKDYQNYIYKMINTLEII